MRLLHALGLVDGCVDRIVFAFETRVVFSPHPVDDLARLAEHPHPVTQLREAVAVGTPLVLVPARSDASVQPAVAGDVYRGGDLGVQRRIAVAVATYHLPDLDVLRIPRQRRADRPCLEAGLELRGGNGMEVVEDPDRVPSALVRRAGDARHGLILFDRVLYLGKVHPPALRHEDSESGCHALLLSVTSQAASHNSRRSAAASATDSS